MLVPRPYGRLPHWTPLYLFLLICYFFLQPHTPSQLLETPKFLPTDFSSSAEYHILQNFTCPSPYCPNRPIYNSALGSEDPRQRYIFKHALSSGFEGTVSIYFDTVTNQDVAIKSFHEHTSPLRNLVPVPAQEIFGTSRWPTELEFMLLRASTLHTHTSSTKPDGLVSLVDYFVIDDGNEKHWHIVTPFYSHGTLSNAGPTIAILLNQSLPLTPASLHELFFPSYVRLVNTLTSSLHDHGYCHDDIKPSNIFISSSPFLWLLGDFGNVREISHSYHTSNFWKTQKQEDECRQNDKKRLLKTYFSFLRSFFSENTEVFDTEFLDRREEWTRVYWDTVSQASGATYHQRDGAMERMTTQSDHKSEQMTLQQDHTSSSQSVIQPHNASVGQLKKTTIPWYAPIKLLLPDKLAAKVLVDKELYCSFRSWSGRFWDKFIFSG